MSELIERLKARWIADGLSLRPGATSEALDAFEAKYQVALPPLVRDYFASVDGTGDNSDGVFIHFWPLSEVKTIMDYHGWSPDQAAGLEGWFYFADFMISSHDFAIRLTSDPADDGPVMFADGELYPLALSFAGFLDRYLADRKSLRYYFPLIEGRSIAGNDEPVSPC